MRCLKLLGERLMARDFDRQTTELHIRAALLNRFTQPRHAEDAARCITPMGIRGASASGRVAQQSPGTGGEDKA